MVSGQRFAFSEQSIPMPPRKKRFPIVVRLDGADLYEDVLKNSASGRGHA